VVGAERLLEDGECAPIERLGPLKFIVPFIPQRQVLERRGDIRVVRAEHLLHGGQRLLEERLGLR
jgi:hypothetical protein